MGMNVQAWLASLQALLPPGRAFTREPGANLTSLLEGAAAMFAAAEDRALDLRNQSADPLIATDMLPDWERLLGLPDECTADLLLSLADRQRIAGQRLVELGGQSRAHFIDLAARLGEPGCTISEFRPFNCNDDCNDALNGPDDRFTWRVNIPRPAGDVRWMTCNDDCTSALQEFTPSLIECPISERRPAHTTVLFSYAP
jgi:uncharacterized protein YmfQ (DUF2313 family)